MTTQLPSAGWYQDPSGKPGQMYWDGQRWHTAMPARPSAAAAPDRWDQLRPYIEKARPHVDNGRRFWLGLSRRSQFLFAIAGLLVMVAGVAVPVTAFGDFFGGTRPSSLTPGQRFVHDVAVAGIVSNDPTVKADVNPPASPETTAKIASIATSICADLNNGTSEDEEAMQLYKSALDASPTSGFHLSHDKAVQIVSSAVRDVCPGK